MIFEKITAGVILLLIPLFLCQLQANEFTEQRQNIQVHKLHTGNGLPDNSINVIAQDPTGFIWIATNNGLARFDGIKTKVYQRNKEYASALPNNRINDLLIDSTGVIWLAAQKKLIRFYPDREQFEDLTDGRITQFADNTSEILRIHKDNGHRIWILRENHSFTLFDILNDSIYCVLEKSQHFPESVHLPELQLKDSHGNYWFVSGQGFYRVKIVAGEPTVDFIGGNLHPGISAPSRPHMIFETRQGQLYFTNNGLFLFTQDPSEANSQGLNSNDFRYISLFNKSFPGNEREFFIHDLHEDAHGDVWISTELHGLKRYDPLKGTVKEINHEPLDFNQRPGKSPIFASDNEGFLWMVFNNHVISRYDHHSQTFSSFFHNPHDRNSLPDNIYAINFSRRLMQDRAGNYWLIAWDQLCFFDLKKDKFPLINSMQGTRPRLSANHVWGIYEDRDSLLWVGVTNTGLNIVNKKTGSVYEYLANQNERYAGFRTITSFLSSGNDEYWIGSIPVSRYSFNPNTRAIRLINEFRPSPDDKQSISTWVIFCMFKDSRGRIWLGTNGQGADRYLEPSPGYPHGSFVNYGTTTDNKNGLAGKQVWHIMEDDRQRLWFSTENGLTIMNMDDESFTNYYSSPGDSSKLAAPFVRQSLQDSKGRFWIATEGGGLHLFHENTGTFEYFNTSTGFPADIVYAVLEDENGFLWISSNTGIVRFNPETREHIVFSVEDGLQDNHFRAGAYHMGPSRTIYFGGKKGLNYFRPADIEVSDYKPEIVFVSLKIMGEEITSHTSYKGKTLLPDGLAHANHITLPYNRNSLSIEFAALDFSAPARLRYQYSVTGSNEYLTETTAENRIVNLSILPPGKYILKVRSSNADGVWVDNFRELQITILPPWWRTNWAYLVYFALTVAALLAARKIILVQLDYRQNIKLEQMKTRFFMNISHEFRTPLTLILGPINSMVSKEMDPAEHNKSLSLIQRNANRMLRLVNQLLDLRRLETKTAKLNVTKANVFEFLESIYHSFSHLAEKQKNKYNLIIKKGNPKSAQYNHYFDADVLEKILYNLLSNAFKFTPDGGEIAINVSITCDMMLSIEISDSGTGIDDEHLHHIFDRFYQASNPLRKQSGTGIGLALTREMIDLHRGTITVSSNKGLGTQFTVTIPISKNAYNADEIQENTLQPWAEKYPYINKNPIDIETNPTQILQGNHQKGKPLLLLADDNEDLLAFLADELKNEYSLLLASNGHDALALATREIPDIIISDVMMPGMDGLEFCTKIKADINTRHIPVILLTAKSEIESQISGLKTGADDYISKPFNTETLLLKINNITQSRLQFMKKYSDPANLNLMDLARNCPDKEFMQKLLNLIHENLHNSELSVGFLAEKIGMSQSQLYRKINSLTSDTPNGLILSVRFKDAAQMLLTTEMNISEIAYAVGMSSPSYFTASFTKYFKISPKKFRETKKIPPNKTQDNP